MAYFETKVLDDQIKAMPTIDTASGSIASFDTDLTENLIDVKCQIVAKQASGTPSPVNPLPITTYTEMNVLHSGSDTSSPTVYNIPFGQTVANGVLDITTGKLVIDRVILDIDNTGWFSFYVGSGNASAVKQFDVLPKYIEGITSYNGSIMNMGVEQQNYWAGAHENDICPDMGYAYQVVSNKMQLRIHRSDVASNSNVTNFRNNLPNGLQICVYLETPQEIQLDSITLQALLNENNIWCDTNGDTSVKYILTIGKAIS